MESLNDPAKMAVMAEQIKNIDNNVKQIIDNLAKNYVTLDKLALVADKADRLEKIVYGVIMILIAGIITLGFSFFKPK